MTPGLRVVESPPKADIVREKRGAARSGERGVARSERTIIRRAHAIVERLCARFARLTVIPLLLALATSCDLLRPALVGVPVETRFAFVNLSRTQYASLAVRVHNDEVNQDDPSAAFVRTPLLAPGAIYRASFLELLGTGCPESLDFQVLVYRRINADLPIGLDDGEEVESTPAVAGEIDNLPACGVQTLVTYTVVHWEAPEGTARVKIAQDSAVDAALRASGRFPNVDAAWEVQGVDPALADVPPSAPAEQVSIAGHVTRANGSGVEGVGVLIRSRFRVRLDDADVSNDPDAGFGDPLAFTVTDAQGAFSFDRPAGGYRVEFFADEFSFRPAIMDVESPIEVIQVIAEPF